MFTLYKKEIRSFLTSITGYLVVLVFLIITGLFLFVFQGEMNILDNGYSSLDPLFIMAPWVFLFLIPAITMRMFADEQKSGTMELLLTKPLRDWQIILSKFLAGFSLVALSLLPTLIYYFTAYELGAQPGNIDQGGTIGSYFGLLFLGAAYVAIGLFASSLTTNQIVSFILAVFMSFFMYSGFDSISTFAGSGNDYILEYLGIASHYVGMSRGVIDSRDLLYFLCLILLMGAATRLVLQSRKW